MSSGKGMELARQQDVLPATTHTGSQDVTPRGIPVRSIDDLSRLAAMVFKSGLAKSFANVEAVGVAIATGLELGLSAMQALQSVVVINGRPGLSGSGAKALVEASGLLEEFDEWFEVGGKRFDDPGSNYADTTAACCRVRRAGRQPRVIRFAVADAKRAGLWAKAGPWTQYPARMLRWRALGFALNDTFPDVLKGFKTAEELADYPAGRAHAAPVDVLPMEPAPAAAPVVEAEPEPPADDGELAPVDLLFKLHALLLKRAKRWAGALDHVQAVGMPDQFTEPASDDDVVALGAWLRKADAERIAAILEGRK